MGGKGKKKDRKGGKVPKPSRVQASQPDGGGALNDFRGAEFTNSQVLGRGTMTATTYVQQYAPVPTATDALPQLPVGFTGREDDLAFVLGVLDPDRAGGPAVAVLSGWGGVGKTTLAYAAGHASQSQGWFTGVLLIDLHGYDPHPTQADDALEALLRSLGVRPEHLPPPGAGREAWYRSQLNARQGAGERLLVVADNASSVSQVRPLLPPGHHGMVVTSRHRLAGMGRMRTVNELQPEDAVALLDAALRGNDPDDARVEEEPEAAERVVLACACLPLALQITAALLAQDGGQPLSERADALSDTQGVLDGLNDGERNLRATFDQSLDRHTPQAQDLFRLLSLNPGPDISTAAAAVLADQPQSATERLLGQLAASHLIDRNPSVRGRWRMHDLLRAYAHEQAQTVMGRGRTPRRRYEQSQTRLIDYYVQHADAARSHIPSVAEQPHTAMFADRGQALHWFDNERENLIAAAHLNPRASIKLGFRLGTYLRWRRRLQDNLVVRSLALDACITLGETHNVAGAWDNLGTALKELHRYDDALHAHQIARDLHQQTGNTTGEANAWNNLGTTLQELHRYDDALHAHQTARDLYQQTGNTTGHAHAWNNLGTTLHELHRYDDALHALETARDLHEQTGDITGQAIAWNNLGTTLQELHRYNDALHAVQLSRDLHEQIGDITGQAIAWNNLGTTLQELHRYDDALHALETSRDLHEQTGDTTGQAIAWNSFGLALKELKRYDDALLALETSRDLHERIGDTHGEANAWNNLGTALQEVNRYDDALHALKTSRDLHEQIGDTTGQAVAWNNLGTTLRELRRYDEALAAGRLAVAMLTKAQDWFRAGEAWGELATTLSATEADAAPVRGAWAESAAAYTRAGAEKEAAASRAKVGEMDVTQEETPAEVHSASHGEVPAERG
ncbi:tetratricopeptide repeat protein [Streptomyces sp. NPDC055992]|uniref:ATP-binding protein n=1 Tax=Streptomyces sp. NPDC055992 TaxID=3345673 RepID=UPI0035E082AA